MSRWSVLCVWFWSGFVWPLDVFVRNQPVGEVLPQLAAELGESILLQEGIDAKVTLAIRDADWPQILDAIAMQLDLEVAWQEDIALLVPKRSPVNSPHAPSAAAHCDHKVWHLRHGEADKVGAHIKQYFQGIQIIVDDRTNALMTHYCGPSGPLELAITWLDSPMRQIEIAAEIAQVKESVQHQLGVNWEANLIDATGNGLIGSAGLDLSSSPVVLGISGSSDSLTLSATLDWLEREGEASVLARPKIVTSEGQPARIESGTEIPYQVMNDENLSVEFRQAGLVLEVTPEVKDEHTLLMKLKIHQDAVGDMVNGVPSLETNRVQTQVEVKDGETLVLGGIFREENIVSVSKVPVLGDVPVLGKLFRQETQKQEKVELLVFITPKLLKMSVN